MAIKDLFDEQKSQSISNRGQSKKTLDQFSQEVESAAYVKQYAAQESKVIADLDYSSASNFAKYGSATKYYENAIKRIHSQYPYDGSGAEQLEFKNNLTQLESYVLDELYPKTTGYAIFSPDGWGTQTADVGMYGLSDNPEYIQFYSEVSENCYDTKINQRGNLHLNWESGSCVEFWMKKDGFPPLVGSGGTTDEAILQISGNVGDNFYITIYRAGGDNNKFSVDFEKAAAVIFSFQPTITSLTTFADSAWHHYAFVLQEDSTNNMNLKTYVDGKFNSVQNASMTGLQDVALSGSLVGTLGALGAFNAGTTIAPGYGKLSGSLDEFRIWRSARTAKQIGQNYFRNVFGGTNTDGSKYYYNAAGASSLVDLGVYFKFNAGITGHNNLDSVVLDYSGRLSNGSWTGYTAAARNTGSAITLSGVSTETPDPIIYSVHPDVITLSTNLEMSGTQYDATNNGSLVNSMPLWVLDEDNSTGETLSNFLQVMASYFDTLHMQIAQMRKFKDAEYHQNDAVDPNPYNARLLNSLGFEAPELFVDADVLKAVFDQDDKRKYEEKISTLKNLIYKNIYNNLVYINKSKGTLKAFRNLMRCYGIDDSIFNYNIYATNTEYTIEGDYINTVIKKDYIDMTPFSDAQNAEGVIYNFQSGGDSNSSGYISASTNVNVGFTVAVDAIFPQKPPNYDDTINFYPPTTTVTASVFGIASASLPTDTTVITPAGDNADIKVRAIRRDNTTKFQLTSSLFSGPLETDAFYDVYDNSRWSISVAVKPTEHPFNSEVAAASTYTIEFNGYNYNLDILSNSFEGYQEISNANGAAFLTGSNKRVYVGAEKTNVTGALQYRTNMRLLSALSWADYLTTTELKSRARDIEAYGRATPSQNTFVFEAYGGLGAVYIPRIKTLASHWGFNSATSSNTAGKFTVSDLSSGSLSLVNSTEYPSNYSEVVNIQNTAQGAGFAVSSQVKKIDFINLSKQQLPENLSVSSMVSILESDDDLIFRDSRPIRFFIAFEASMYDVISREMLNMFSSVVDFNTLIGSPLNYYKQDYKDFRILRDLFYDKVENVPDLDKFVNLYKFLDGAIEGVVHNLIPASAETSQRVRSVIENHILERSKYTKPVFLDASAIQDTAKFNKKAVIPPSKLDPNTGIYPSDEKENGNPSVGGDGVEVITKNSGMQSEGNVANVAKTNPTWHRPFSFANTNAARDFANSELNKYSQNSYFGANNAIGYNSWYKFDAKRNSPDLEIYSSDAGIRETLMSTQFAAKLAAKTLASTTAAKLSIDLETSIKSFIKTGINNTPDVLLSFLQEEQETNQIGVENVPTQTFFDFGNAPFKNKVQTLLDASFHSRELTFDSKQLPITFISASSAVSTTRVNDQYVIIQGLHNDALYHNGETPLQGPFVEKHVGGFKHRHQPLVLDPADGTTAIEQDRPEIYKVENAGAVLRIYNPRIVDAFTSPTYNFNIPRVKYSREELAKRVYNIRNIKSTTGSQSTRVQGNYDKNYQVISTADRSANNPAFVQQGGFTLVELESPYVSGTLDYVKPNRALADGTYNQTVFVQRFSAPGDDTTMTPIYLDYASAQFSAYNALPYRNLLAHDALQDFLQIPGNVTYHGYQSGSQVTASYYKVNPNPVRRLKYNIAGTLYSGSFFDNGFVSYNIPNKDFGYFWISASADPTLQSNMDALYGFATSSNGITFISGAMRGPPSRPESNFINFAGYITPAEIIDTAGVHYEIVGDQNLLVAPTVFTDGTLPTLVSVYFLNINGDYGYPSWKQIRGAEHPVARYLNKNNFALADVGGTRVQQAKITSKYKPLVHELLTKELLGDRAPERYSKIQYTYANNYGFYGDYYDATGSKIDNLYPDKNIRTVDKKDSVLYNLSGIYTGRFLRQPVEFPKMIRLAYNEVVWPKETETYKETTRERTQFSFQWRDSMANRVEDGKIWPMDYELVDGSLEEGELMNISLDGPSYGRYRIKYINSASYANLCCTPKNIVQFGGADSGERGPFPDTQEDFSQDIRLIGQNYSIIPEYNVNDYVGDILRGQDQYASDRQALTLTGSAATVDNNEFLEKFCNSDYLSSYDYISELHNEEASSISITIKGLKKLMPYDGFYPSQRTTQLSTLFSEYYTTSMVTIEGADATYQTLTNTIFSRLAYGSIRAGVAIDSAIWQGGVLTGSNPSAANFFNPTASWYRLPFETIIDPLFYAGGQPIIENDPENLFNSTASFHQDTTTYSPAASNFYANVVDTFINGSKVSTIRSAPEASWNFDLSGQYTNYKMDIVFSKDGASTQFIHSDITANGCPYTAHAPFYSPLKLTTATTELYWQKHILLGSSSCEIPPWAVGEANEAYVTIDFDVGAYTASLGSGARFANPTLAELLAFSTRTYVNKDMWTQLSTSLDTQSTSNVNSPYMTIEAGVNAFNYNPVDRTWNVNTRCEFPFLNFAYASAENSASAGGGATDVGCDGATMGLWHQYVDLDVDTSPDVYQQDSPFRLYVRPTGSTDTVGNLAAAVGFDTEQKIVSQRAVSKLLNEYVVVVPYFVNECDEEVFFYLSLDEWESSLGEYREQGIIRNSVQEMIDKMQKIVLPPKLDFLEQRLRTRGKRFADRKDYSPVLPPFAMYIFEFSELMDEKDLSDWWQGVIPSQGTKAVLDNITIKHPVADGELISPKLLSDDLYGGKLPSQMRFKIFKAKQRGLRTYDDLLNQSFGFRTSQTGYTYNWPYDFYSLVEMAKVDVEFEFGAPRDSLGNVVRVSPSDAIEGELTALGVVPAAAQAEPSIPLLQLPFAVPTTERERATRETGRERATGQGLFGLMPGLMPTATGCPEGFVLSVLSGQCIEEETGLGDISITSTGAQTTTAIACNPDTQCCDPKATNYKGPKPCRVPGTTTGVTSAGTGARTTSLDQLDYQKALAGYTGQLPTTGTPTPRTPPTPTRNASLMSRLQEFLREEETPTDRDGGGGRY